MFIPWGAHRLARRRGSFHSLDDEMNGHLWICCEHCSFTMRFASSTTQRSFEDDSQYTTSKSVNPGPSEQPDLYISVAVECFVIGDPIVAESVAIATRLAMGSIEVEALRLRESFDADANEDTCISSSLASASLSLASLGGGVTRIADLSSASRSRLSKNSPLNLVSSSSWRFGNFNEPRCRTAFRRHARISSAFFFLPIVIP